MFKVTIEQRFPRCEEVKSYYDTHQDLMTLESIHRELSSWFKDSEMICGRGGRHVWLSSAETKRRYMIIEEV